MSQHTNSHGVKVTSSSKDAIELLDKAILELVGWRGDPIATIEKAIAIDPHFVMGHVFRGMLHALNTQPPTAPGIQISLASALNSLSKSHSQREHQHVVAFNHFAQGRQRKATAIWDEILVSFPSDILAIKFSHDVYSLFVGDPIRSRDSIARVYHIWRSDHSSLPTFPYLLGMYSFGLEETQNFRKAEMVARRALELEPGDGWAAHTVLHIMDEEGRQREGIQFVQDTKKNWKDTSLSVHLHWHSALFHLELEQYQKVVEMFDQDIWKPRTELTADLIDSASLLFRCEMAGIEMGTQRWNHVLEELTPFSEDHMSVFNDAHMAMCMGYLRARTFEADLANSIKTKIEHHKDDQDLTQVQIYSRVGVPLLEALANWGRKDYGGVVKRLTPIRYDIPLIGGSHVQRDLFQSILIRSSLNDKNYPLANSLLSERVELLPRSPQTWKLYSEALSGLGRSQDADSAQQQYKSLLQTNASD